MPDAITPAERHAQQVEAWNGPMGAQWVANEARTERALAPVLRALLDIALVQPGETILDIGCGAGGTTQALAEAVGPAGRVVGLDVSETILAAARARLAGFAHVELVRADAAEWVKPGPQADLLFSRFGVMFFGDPPAAFANLRRSLAPDGRLAFACWRPVADNPWVGVPAAAAATVVPMPPPPGPEEPGQFAFGDADRVRRILAAAGFAAPNVQAWDFTMRYPADDLRATAEAMAGGGQVGRLLRDQPDSVRPAVVDAIAAALPAHVRDDRVVLGASVWLVTARPK